MMQQVVFLADWQLRAAQGKVEYTLEMFQFPSGVELPPPCFVATSIDWLIQKFPVQPPSEGLLRLHPATKSLSQVGGLDKLKFEDVQKIKALIGGSDGRGHAEAMPLQFTPPSRSAWLTCFCVP